ncbi:MAG: VWA domain-containing protein [Deltaproteobacteria bacterium]|nr:VWA domain-containing protein [Deltaproteobacteria bacterium]
MGLAVTRVAAAPPAVATGTIATASGDCQHADVTLQVSGVGDAVTERLPLDVMIVFDRSGSMAGTAIGDAKAAANLLIGELDNGNDRVGLTSFATSPLLNSALTSSFGTVTSAINGLVANGSTNIGGGVQTGQTEIATHGRAAPTVRVMVVLSDGVANVAANGTSCATSPTAPTTCTNDAITQAATAKAAGTIVFSIGLNLGSLPTNVAAVARNTLRAMATDTAKYFESPSSSDLADIFAEIASQVTNLAGSNVIVTDILPAGVTYVAGSATPAPASVSGQTLTWNLGIISIGQMHTISFTVALDSADPNQLVDVFPDSRADYTNYLGQSASTPFPQTFVSVTACPTPTPTDTPTLPTATATDTPTAEDTPTDTPPPTATDTPTPSATPSFTVPPTATAGAAGVACPPTPLAGCRGAGKSLLRVRNIANDGRDKFLWKWGRGQSTTPADFGSPTTTTQYLLCLYGGTPAALLSDGEYVVPTGQHWTAYGSRTMRYLDKTATAPDGIQKVVLRSNTQGKARLMLRGRGLNLPDPALPIAPDDFPLVVQLVNSPSTGACWESRFAAGAALRNTATQVKLRQSP